MPCEEWVGPVFQDTGYGRVRTRLGDRTAHSYTWEECFGPIEDGLVIAHHCDNRPCRQPLHLFKTTKAGNNRDMAAKGRHFKQQNTHCPNDHPFDTGNTRTGDGYRRCRQCMTDKQQRYRARKRSLLRTGQLFPPITEEITHA